MHLGRIVPLWMAASALAAGSAGAAGFASIEPGARALGMGGAFGAQADDPSATLWNPGGLAFLDERSFQADVAILSLGEDTFGGPAGSGRQARAVEPVGAFYWVEPLRPGWVLGLAAHTPYRIDTEWADPDSWPGRFVAEKATLRVLDLNSTLAFRATRRLGLAVGAVLRASELRLRRRETVTDPTARLAREAARFELDGEVESSLGWSFGLLHRPGRRFSWGLTYRSAVEAEQEGDVRLTAIPSGDPDFDAAVAAALPLDQDLPSSTTIDFPDWINLAAAYQATPTVLVELDVSRTGWSAIDSTDVIVQSAPMLDSTLMSGWEDSETYRAGVRWSGQGNSEWRLGVYFDESPQPDGDASAILADADRAGFSVGYGSTVGRVRAAFALVYVDFSARKTVDGTWRSRAWTLATSFAW